jgi:hypothetical protein
MLTTTTIKEEEKAKMKNNNDNKENIFHFFLEYQKQRTIARAPA